MDFFLHNYFSVICISPFRTLSLVPCPSLIGLFVFLMFSGCSSLYILDANPLSDT